MCSFYTGMKVRKPTPWEITMVEAYQKKAELFRSMYLPDCFEKAVDENAFEKVVEKAAENKTCRKTFISKIIKFLGKIF